jgi:hypothetical protein
MMQLACAQSGLELAARARQMAAATANNEKRENDNAATNAEPILLDEIRVFGAVDPEDYRRPEKTQLQKFSAHLERQHHLTPAEMAKLSLCFIGLCPGVPPEIAPEQRTEMRVRGGSLAAPMRGTLQ